MLPGKKGELESTQMHAISFSMEKESERSPTLVGEGEGQVEVLDDGEILVTYERSVIVRSHTL